jgi:hypothetical protein
LRSKWLCHADARQVFDLPFRAQILMVYDHSGSETRRKKKARRRQVADSPRIGVAKPLEKGPIESRLQHA